MNNHLILICRENIIGTDTSNLVYTEIKVRAKKLDGDYIQSTDYPHLVEKELSTSEIDNFKANIHLYKKVKENEHGIIYQSGDDFKEKYWSLFPKEVEEVKPVKVKKERTHKVCSQCKKKLPVKDFYLRQNKQLFSKCKKCVLNNSKSQDKKLSLQKSI